MIGIIKIILIDNDGDDDDDGFTIYGSESPCTILG